MTRPVPPPRHAMLPNRNARADEIMTRSAPSMTFPAFAFAAAYHGVRAAMQLDLLPGRNPIVIGYCCRQPTITPRPLLPLLPATGSTRLLRRATLPYKTTPLVGCTSFFFPFLYLFFFSLFLFLQLTDACRAYA